MQDDVMSPTLLLSRETGKFTFFTVPYPPPVHVNYPCVSPVFSFLTSRVVSKKNLIQQIISKIWEIKYELLGADQRSALDESERNTGADQMSQNQTRSILN